MRQCRRGRPARFGSSRRGTPTCWSTRGGPGSRPHLLSADLQLEDAAVPTLVDGAVAGTWRYEDGRVVLDPFDELPTRRRRAVDEEADRLAAWHAEDGA